MHWMQGPGFYEHDPAVNHGSNYSDFERILHGVFLKKRMPEGLLVPIPKTSFFEASGGIQQAIK